MPESVKNVIESHLFKITISIATIITTVIVLPGLSAWAVWLTAGHYELEQAVTVEDKTSMHETDRKELEKLMHENASQIQSLTIIQNATNEQLKQVVATNMVLTTGQAEMKSSLNEMFRRIDRMDTKTK